MGTCLIANPAAGGGRAASSISAIHRIVEDAMGTCRLVRSEGPGGVRRCVEDALAQGATKLVVVGGDGTVNEAVNGIFSSDAGLRNPPEVLFYPIGTGGDFARVTGCDRLKGAALLNASSSRRIDVGRLEWPGVPGAHFFLNIASIGVSAAIAQRVNRTGMRKGRLSFLIGTLATLLKWRDVPVRLVLDTGFEAEVRATCIAIANGRSFGGGMRIAPCALLDDGLFDVVLLENMGAATFVLHGRKLFRGTHLSLDGASMHRCRRVTLTPVGAPLLLEADGEHPGHGAVDISLVPGALPVLAPWHLVDTVG